MTPAVACPGVDRLRALLDGTLPEVEQAELNAHLETCVKCQQAIEGLAAGKETWDGTARQLAGEQPEPDEALLRVIHEVKGEGSHSETQGEGGHGQPSLDFLKPSDQPGHLGRLAHYEILELTGHGGFGIVLKAFDTSLRRIVAIKVLSPHLATNATARRRFIREAVAAAAVSHDHVVAIHAVEESHNPPFIVMQFIEGKSLQQRIDCSGPLELREILRIGMQTAGGLAAAHAQGLVHRDIKPANILLENGVERVKITDFGLARAVDDVSVTQSGVVAGTPQYMSPEQADGKPIDHRSDLFSLGSVLYAMCTGRAPFRATSTLAVLRRVCEQSPRPIREVNPDVPDWLEAIVAKLHAKQPGDRFQSADEVRELLGRHLAHLQKPTVVPQPAPVAAPPSGLAGVESSSPQPVSPVEQVFSFWLKPQPGYARHVGVPLLVLLAAWGLIVAVLLARSGTPQEWLILTLTGGLLLFPLGFVVLTLRWSMVRKSAAVVTAQSASPPDFSYKRRRRWRLATLGLLGVAGIVYWLQFHIPSGKARLEIETDGEIQGLKVLVKRAGQVVTVIQPETQRSVELTPGVYELFSEGWWKGPGKPVLPATVTLAAGERQVARVSLYRTEIERNAEAMLRRTDPDVPRLEGRWSVVSQEFAGKPFSSPDRPASVEWIEFEGNRMRQRPWSTETVLEQLYAIDSTQFLPKRIDLFGVGSKRHEGTGIYRLDGDTLTLCIVSPDEGTRANQFGTSAVEKHVLTVCRREQPDPSTIAATPIADADSIAWGRPSLPNGMQLGLELDPRKEVYRAGEVVTARLTLRNSGTSEILTTLPRLEVLEKFDFDLSLLDDRDNKLPWTWGAAHKRRELFTVSGGIALHLKPDATHELPAAEIVIGKGIASPTAMAFFEVEPGQSCRLAAKLGTYGYAKGEGKPLESGVIRFRVTTPDDERASKPLPTTEELDRLVELAERELGRVQKLVEVKAAPPSAAEEAEIKVIEAHVRRARVRQDPIEVVSQLRRLVEIREAERSRVDALVKAGAAPTSDLEKAEEQLIEARLELKEADAALEKVRPGTPASPPSSPPAPDSGTTESSGAKIQNDTVPDGFQTSVLNDDVRWDARKFKGPYDILTATFEPTSQQITWTLRAPPRHGPTFEFHAVLYDKQGQVVIEDAPLSWSAGRRDDGPVHLASLDLRWIARRLGDAAPEVAAVRVETFEDRPYGRLRNVSSTVHDGSSRVPEQLITELLPDDVAWRHQRFRSGFEVLEVSFDPATRHVTWVMELLPRTYMGHAFRVGFYDKSGMRLDPAAPLVWHTGQRDGHTIDFAVLDLAYFAEMLGDRTRDVATVAIEVFGEQ